MENNARREEYAQKLLDEIQERWGINGMELINLAREEAKRREKTGWYQKRLQEIKDSVYGYTIKGFAVPQELIEEARRVEKRIKMIEKKQSLAGKPEGTEDE